MPPESVYKSKACREHERGGGIFSTFDGTQTNNESTTPIQHSLSTDSLLFSENNKDDDICDVDGCFEVQCHQVFIGMVTMQYQAQTDIVSFIERLEKSCIRFVHFSKENELRSRVFSEKMGLESGWNCHISLLSTDEHSNAASPRSTSNNFETTNVFSNVEINIDDEDSELNKLLPNTT